MNFLADFFRELDNFVDDAANRRLGNGAKFYGKRKSSFYGEDVRCATARSAASHLPRKGTHEESAPRGP